MTVVMWTLTHALAVVPAADAELSGSRGAWTGEELAAGDFNGDGYDDLAILSPTTPRAAVHLGGPTGLAAAADLVAGVELDRAVALDVNGDGYDDVVVQSQYGAVRTLDLHLGSASGLLTTPAWSTTHAAIYQLARGDVDGDGFDDLLITVPEALSYAGPVNLVLRYAGSAAGLPALPSQTWTGGYGYGHGVAAADVNGDGYDDVVAGSPYDGPGGNGELVVYYGSSSGAAASASRSIGCPAGGWDLGADVVAGGDLNGDGYGDLIAAAYFPATRDFVVVSGSAGPLSVLQHLTGNGSDFPRMAMVPDTDGDGDDEAILAAPRATLGGVSSRGAAGVHHGTAGGLLAPVPGNYVLGAAASDGCGEAVVSADFDGNGSADWAVACPRQGPNGVVAVHYDAL